MCVSGITLDADSPVMSLAELSSDLKAAAQASAHNSQQQRFRYFAVCAHRAALTSADICTHENLHRRRWQRMFTADRGHASSIPTAVAFVICMSWLPVVDAEMLVVSTDGGGPHAALRGDTRSIPACHVHVRSSFSTDT